MATDSKTPSGIWSAHAAEIWESRFEPQRGPIFAAILAATKMVPGATVLDAGCGGGGVSLAASAAGAKVLGCDISEGVLATARRKVPTGEFRIGNLAALPYEADMFDVVVACDCMHSQQDAVTVISGVCSRNGQNRTLSFWKSPRRRYAPLKGRSALNLPRSTCLLCRQA